jgi:methylated-DNA-[protein]-cysteine S-methyltransferase
MELNFATVSSPVGNWTVEGTDLGVTHIYMPHDIVPAASSRPHAVVTLAARQLDEYFRGRRTSFDVTLAEAKGTLFQHDVWRILQSLPYGSVATYAHVAQLAGRPRAARAVGNANHANPWPVIVPCHRVVASHGIGGYGGGEEVKRFLLALEGVNVG